MRNRGNHRLAVLTASATFLLLFVGGLVTSTGSGLAVPDWPLSFGRFFPPMVGGVLFEHGHRLAATVVGCLTVILAFSIVLDEPRRSVRALALLSVLAVVLQGMLGGATVLYKLPLAVSVAHACLAQTFFCLTVALAVLTGAEWQAPAPAAASPLPAIAATTTALIFGQLVLGALVRHMGAGLAIPDFPLAFGRLVPPLATSLITIHFAHRVGALVATLSVVTTAAVAARFHRGDDRLERPVLLAVALLVLQIMLGGAAVLSHRAVLATTTHLVVGAALLATSLTLTLRASRLIGWRRPAHAPSAFGSPRVRMTPAAIFSTGRLVRRRLTDYLALAKPRVVLMVLVTTAVGYLLAATTRPALLPLIETLVGTALAAGGTLALNQWMERDLDALMTRTRHRPIPDGRVLPAEGFAVGAMLLVSGVAVLALVVNGLAATLTGAIAVVYLLVYTLLKPVTPLSVIPGAISGALPPVAGWAASAGQLGAAPWALAGILFFWQIAHTLAIGHLYRQDYARAGMRILPVVDDDGVSTSLQAFNNCLALLPVGVLPALIGLSGAVYLVVSILLALGFLWTAGGFVRDRSPAAARRLLMASLVYLPTLLIIMALDRSGP
jgi:protoheme IX farnesyltransferase